MWSWLDAALEYVPQWLEFQLRHHDQPGGQVAITHDGEVVLEQAFGVADLSTGEALTPLHFMRAASHSKSFTAAGVLRLQEQGELRLDDPVEQYAQDVHPAVGQATIAQLLSHSAGLTRDGRDSGQFSDRRPYLSRDELIADLREPPPLEPGERFKYSNHGYGLLGLIIETVTGEPYADWITREVVRPAGLEAVAPDITLARGAPVARGHSSKLPLGQRVVIPGNNPSNAIMPAGGFVATAGSLARFFHQLSPSAEQSFLSRSSRREMTRRHWRDEDLSVERHYGLGIISGPPGEWEWFGHSGAFQGFLSRTAVLPRKGLAIAVMTNSIDGPAHMWVEGIIHILKTFADKGAPKPEIADWLGRWWTIWGAVDQVPVGDRVLGATPAYFLPFTDASQMEVTGPDTGRIARAAGLNNHGEAVRRVRDDNGNVREVWVGGTRLVSEEELRDEMKLRYQS